MLLIKRAHQHLFCIIITSIHPIKHKSKFTTNIYSHKNIYILNICLVLFYFIILFFFKHDNKWYIPIIRFVNLGYAIRQLRLRLKLVKTHKGQTHKKFASQQEGTSTFVPLHYNKHSSHQARVRSQQKSIHIKAYISWIFVLSCYY